MGLFLSINDDQKRRFFKGFLTITNNEKTTSYNPGWGMGWGKRWGTENELHCASFGLVIAQIQC